MDYGNGQYYIDYPNGNNSRCHNCNNNFKPPAQKPRFEVVQKKIVVQEVRRIIDPNQGGGNRHNAVAFKPLKPAKDVVVQRGPAQRGRREVCFTDDDIEDACKFLSQ